MKTIETLNIPDYAKHKNYIVAAVQNDGSMWFCGAWNDIEKAKTMADEIKKQSLIAAIISTNQRSTLNMPQIGRCIT